ncbi:MULTISPECIES: hypothetical protein [Sphingomonas]|uniref:Uncharacterized protein n=1 Tax=Sphingomonas molluscorum TaxID=418184 RepID=A0ABU8Q920_9SPHN|nr:hypothetical protein [Sphingomonas sp. JUb134]MBM7407596.1 hypothetical protein [Sphingomonas sp. JUb134]
MHRPQPSPAPLPMLSRTVRDAIDLDDPATRAWSDHLDAGRIGTRVPPQPGAREAAERTAALFRRLGQAAR